MSTRRVWIVGTVSWDTVVYINDFPKSGGFAQSKDRIDRLGGSAANIAQGVASAGIETGLVTFLGNDDLGKTIHNLLTQTDILHLEILRVDDKSSHALVVIDGAGERTIFALSNNYLSQLSLESIDIRSEDIVVFPLWRPVFFNNLNYAKSRGCHTVVGLEALSDLQKPSADLAIGSEAELPPDLSVADHLNQFKRILVTHGAKGAQLYSSDGILDQPAVATEVIDTTGAGDSFFAGFLTALARGDQQGVFGMKAGALWSAAMVAQYRSIPPNGIDVVGLMDVLSSIKEE